MVRKRPAPSSTSTSVSTPAYQAVSWSRNRARGGLIRASCAEPVARAAQCGDQLRLEAIVDLAPQPPDQDVQQVGKRIVVIVPHVRGDRRAVEDLTRSAITTHGRGDKIGRA